MFKFLKNIFKKNPRRKGRLFAFGVIATLSQKDKQSLRAKKNQLLKYIDAYIDPSQSAFDGEFQSILEHIALTGDGNGQDALQNLVLAGIIDSVIDQLANYSGDDALQFVQGIRSVLILV